MNERRQLTDDEIKDRNFLYTFMIVSMILIPVGGVIGWGFQSVSFLGIQSFGPITKYIVSGFFLVLTIYLFFRILVKYNFKDLPSIN